MNEGHIETLAMNRRILSADLDRLPLCFRSEAE
jgi:hypothetical protein